MVYLLTMVIFHGYVRHDQMVSIMVPLQNWNPASWNPGGFLHRDDAYRDFEADSGV